MVYDKLLAYKKSFQAMSSGQLSRVVFELLALAPRYLPTKPKVAGTYYAGAGIGLAELLRRSNGDDITACLSTAEQPSQQHQADEDCQSIKL